MSHSRFPPCWRKTELVKKHIKLDMIHVGSTHLCHSDDESLLSQHTPWRFILEVLIPAMLYHLKRSNVWFSGSITMSLTWELEFIPFLLKWDASAAKHNLKIMYNIIISLFFIINIPGRILTQNREKRKLAARFFSSHHQAKQDSCRQIWWTLAPCWLNAQHGKLYVKINMISFNHSTDEKQIMTPH